MRRAGDVLPTSRGASLFAHMVGDHEARVEDIFSAPSDGEIGQLTALLAKLRQRLDKAQD